MEIPSIGSFFERYRKLKPTERLIKEVVENYFNNLSLPVNVQSAKLKNKTLYLSINAAAKQYLYTNKKDIKEFLKEKLPEININDIR